MAEQLTEPRQGERGFTLIEVLIALLVLMVGMAGILSLQLTSMQATAFSRHATEASVLAEAKMEELRATPATVLDSGDDRVDARGEQDAAGLFERIWTIAPGPPITMSVTVNWREQGSSDDQIEAYSIVLGSMRSQ